MADPKPAAYTLLPWVRRGLTALVTGTPATSFATLPISLAVNGAAAASPGVRLLGPGDINSIDVRAVLRTDPRDGASTFEPNYLAMVELALPDFPWLFTPSAPAGSSLRPWICLIVVEEIAGVSFTVRPDGVSTLLLDAPVDLRAQLPDLSHIDSWAHAQVTGDHLSGPALNAALDGTSAAHLSRLISPRKLEPGKRYSACIVPTFRAGVNTGLGQPMDDHDVAPAWDQSTTVPLTLPVYYRFRFQTGPGGDFASLAQRIRPLEAPLGAGARSMDASAPGFGVAPIPGLVLGLEGALRPVDYQGATVPPATLTNIRSRLHKALRPPAAPDPLVTPPVYGRTHANRNLPADGAQPAWLADLNLDPRLRAVASAGAQVVQRDQEALMASAWDQLGEIRKANQLLVQAQLARQVSGSLNRRHLDTVAQDGAYLQITTPVHARVRMTLGNATATLLGHIESSRLPGGAISATLRKVARPQGPVARQMKSTASASNIVARLNQPVSAGSAGLTLVAATRVPRGLVTMDAVSAETRVSHMTVTAARIAPGWRLTADAGTPNLFKVASKSLPALPALPTEQTALVRMQEGFRKAATVLGTFLNDTPAPAQDVSALPPLGGAAPLTSTRAQLRARLDPEATILGRIGAQVTLSSDGDALRQQHVGPVFPQPMVSALAELSSDWLLPGISDMPIDRTELLVTNPPFVEAFLIGLNDELSRELLWREFPTDLRATYFSYFWGTNAGGTVSADIPPIASFDPGLHLGEHTAEHAAGERLVLLIRSELFRRYPNAIVSASPAVWNADGKTRRLSDSRSFPIFRGETGADAFFFGFGALTKELALGSDDPAAGKPGWYFSIEEHATEPRFGLEPAATSGAASSWNDLAWPDVTLDHGHLNPAALPPTPGREGLQWGHDAAAMASILMRRPFRVAVHARALIRKQGT